MKKSLMLATALLALTLGACGGTTDPGTDPGTDPTPAVDVPIADGKTTFYFTMAEASVELPSYGSIYMTGGAVGWKTGYDAKEFTKLEGTSIYYVQIADADLNYAADQGYEYQLVVGYNSTANMPTASSGLQWVDARKSVECAAPGGLSNLSFEVKDGEKAINLGTHTWSTALPKPAEPLKNYKFIVEFEEAVPEYGVVMMFGSFNGWKTPEGGDDKKASDKERCDAAKLTPNEDRTIWTMTFAQMVAGDYQCKILVEYADYVEANSNVQWNAVDQTKENYDFTVTQADGDGYALDILGEKATYKLPDPNATLGKVQIIVENSADSGELAALYIGSVLNNWTPTAMTKVDDHFVADYADVTAGEKGFKLLPTEGWDNGIGMNGDNIVVELEVGTHVSATITVSLDFSDARIGVEGFDIEATQVSVSYQD